MWIENIIEAKQRLGISAKEMAARSKLGVSERTIRRILAREADSPRVDTVLDIGDTVGLTWKEIFAESTAVVGDPCVAALPAEIEALRAELDVAIAELAVLRAKVETLTVENNALKDELLDVHRYYIKRSMQ